MAQRGPRWQAQVDALFERAMADGAEMQRRHAAGEDITQALRDWRALFNEYNRLHGAGVAQEPRP